jgi:hypothetical protein
MSGTMNVERRGKTKKEMQIEKERVGKKNSARKAMKKAKEKTTAAARAAVAEDKEQTEEAETGTEMGTGEEEEKGEMDNEVSTPARTENNEEEEEDESESGEEEEEEDEEVLSEKTKLLIAVAVAKEKLKQHKEGRREVARRLKYSSVPTSAGAGGVGNYGRPVSEEGGGATVQGGTKGNGSGSVATQMKMPELAKMKTFNGEMDSDGLDSWIRTVITQTSYYEAAGQLNTEPAKVIFASAHLDGAAADWWYSGEMDKVHTIKEFIIAVNRRFKSSLDADVAAERLNVLKQGSHPVTHYVGRNQQLLIRIPDMDMKTRIRSFIRGLSPQLAQKLRELRPVTIQDAYEQAIRIEGSFVTSQGNRFSTLSNMETNEEEEEDEEEKPVTLAAVRRMMEMQRETKSTGGGAGTPAAPDVSKIKCYGCGKMGHYKTQCRENKSKGKGKDKSKIKCYGCGKMGHYQSECRSEREQPTTAAPGGQEN